jgi:hypothetical protein
MSTMIDSPAELYRIQKMLRLMSKEQLARQYLNHMVPPYMIDAENARRQEAGQDKQGQAAVPQTMHDQIMGPTQGAAQGGLVRLAGGRRVPGNIDLTNRPIVRNPDGSISTVRSMSFNIDGRQVLLPTISEDGRNLSPQEAVEQYHKTGKHLGIFEDVDDADTYARQLHEMQEEIYLPKARATIPPQQRHAAGGIVKLQEGGGVSGFGTDEDYNPRSIEDVMGIMGPPRPPRNTTGSWTDMQGPPKPEASMWDTMSNSLAQGWPWMYPEADITRRDREYAEGRKPEASWDVDKSAPPRDQRGITEVPEKSTSATATAPYSIDAGTPPMAPESRDPRYYRDLFGNVPKRRVPTLEESVSYGKQLQGKEGFNFSPYLEEQAARRKELAADKESNRSMAMLQAGLGILGEQGPYGFVNIGRGAMKGADYLAKAKEAERRELQAIRDGDFKLAQAQHAEKLSWISAARSYQTDESGAKYEMQTHEFGANKDAVKLSLESEKDQRDFELKMYELEQRRKLAEAGLRGRGGADPWVTDRQAIQKTFEILQREYKDILDADYTTLPGGSKNPRWEFYRKLDELRRKDPKAYYERIWQDAAQTVQNVPALRYQRREGPGIGGQEPYDTGP